MSSIDTIPQITLLPHIDEVFDLHCLSHCAAYMSTDPIFTVTVVNLSGKKYIIKTYSGQSLGSFRNSLSLQIGLDSNIITLLFKGQKIVQSDYETVGNIGITPNCILDCFCRLRGD